MTTYVLSQSPHAWNINRFGENITVTAADLPDEETALKIAIREAREEAPSQILRIAVSGESRIVARFDA